MTGPRQRIDKWLWFARMVKTRTLAQAIVSHGQVRVNRARIGKPSHAVGPGDILTLAVHGRVRVLRVLGVGVRRGPADEARTLFEDMSAPETAGAASEKLLHKG
ncbi:MAG: RNA-binding S4 domain-containing protein [Parvibaculaceae bacterium]